MADTDAVVWVADGQAAEDLDYGDRLVQRLTDLGLRATRRDLTAPDAAASPPQGRLHVLSGGSTSVNDRSGWMTRGLAVTTSLLEGAGRGRHSVVGVCLGSQLIAEALTPGCGTVRAATGIEVGLTEVRWKEAVYDGAGEQVVVPAFHFEEVDHCSLTAAGARVVAGNEHSPVQAFRYGRRVWGFQFHPEFEPADMRRIVLHNHTTIEEYHGSTEAALASVDRLGSSWTPSVFDELIRHVLHSADGAAGA